MDKEIFKQYAALKVEEKKVAGELEKLKPLVKDAIVSIDAEKIASEFGTFTLKPVPVWKFSSAVDAAKKEVERLQEKEKADGTASCEPRYDLVFTAPKAPQAI